MNDSYEKFFRSFKEACESHNIRREMRADFEGAIIRIYCDDMLIVQVKETPDNIDRLYDVAADRLTSWLYLRG